MRASRVATPAISDRPSAIIDSRGGRTLSDFASCDPIFVIGTISCSAIAQPGGTGMFPAFHKPDEPNGCGDLRKA